MLATLCEEEFWGREARRKVVQEEVSIFLITSPLLSLLSYPPLLYRPENYEVFSRDSVKGGTLLIPTEQVRKYR